jgi:hypothetical protein
MVECAPVEKFMDRPAIHNGCAPDLANSEFVVDGLVRTDGRNGLTQLPEPNVLLRLFQSFPIVLEQLADCRSAISPVPLDGPEDGIHFGLAVSRLEMLNQDRDFVVLC